MSSLEIAELTGKLHYSVMRDIRELLEALDEVAYKFAGYYVASNGKRNPCFKLTRDLTFTLVTGYSIPLRQKVIDRWMELEQVVAEAAPVPVSGGCNQRVRTE